MDENKLSFDKKFKLLAQEHFFQREPENKGLNYLGEQPYSRGKNQFKLLPREQSCTRRSKA
jgi:hypothetical protein